MSVIAVLGGTGALGRGLAQRLSAAGHRVIIGSRDSDRAAQAAQALAGDAHGTGNAEAAAEAEIAILAVPFSHQRETLLQVAAALEGKILVDATVCLKPPAVGRVQLPPEGSAGLAARALLGDRVRIVSAFQNVAAVKLQRDGPIDCDVLVTGDDRAACDLVCGLCREMGFRGLYAGPLDNSIATEALTSLLITINREHKVHAGIKISEVA